MSAGVCPGTSRAVACTSPILNVSPSLNRWSNWLPSGRKVRSKLKIFLNPSGLRSSTPCSVDWILETHAHADHLSGARTVDVDDLDQRVHRVDSLAAHRPRGPSRLWDALDGQTVGDDG